MNDEAFRQRVLEQLHSTFALLTKITNQEYCNRALLLALAEQAGMNQEKLEADYEDNLQRILEQVPPNHQHRETYETFLAALQARLKPHPGKPSAD